MKKQQRILIELLAKEFTLMQDEQKALLESFGVCDKEIDLLQPSYDRLAVVMTYLFEERKLTITQRICRKLKEKIKALFRL